MTKAAFIDRDGVINEDRNYVYRISDFIMLPGVIDGLTLLRNSGYLLIIVTNQAGIARGYYSQTEMDHLHKHMRMQFAEKGLALDAIYFCPHHPQGSIKALSILCDCRKPSPGMIFQAAKDFNINLASSILIGDKLIDLQAGKNAGVGRTVIVESGHKVDLTTRFEADLVAENLLAAAQIITGI